MPRLPLLNYLDDAGAKAPARAILLRNFALLDAKAGELVSRCEVLVQGHTIAEVRRDSIPAGDAEVIDLGGRTLMPGLIDLHSHILGECFPVAPKMLPSLMAASAANVMRGMLGRGFTTIRDAGGADYGHKRAVELGLFPGPRLFVSGRAISQTGGHGDSRSQADTREPPMCCAQFPGIGRIADGVPEVRKAVRDELRMGADQIKVMAGGGVGSITDPVEYLQYSMEELQAVVDEAQRAGKYVMAHAITAESVQRCVEAGVRTIEHGNLIDERTARMMAQAGRYLVPTLTIYDVIKRSGRSLGFSEASMQKVDAVWEGNARSLELAAAAGVPMGFGTDVARCPEFQSQEFLLRGAVLPAADVIRSATTVGAEILRLPGKLGTIAPGAFADLIAVDGNPLEDLGLLSGQGENISLIVANGVLMKDKVRGPTDSNRDV
ncbi:amidohydrolase family protein [Ramlibacter sp.]|uniref:metal-dependent hydrolase family protein n=1 Tax=Ramlibacter sp. TaxID=1917967 RepID=UPI003D0E7E44